MHTLFSSQLCKLLWKYFKILLLEHESKQILWLCICKCWQYQVKIWIIKGIWTKWNYLFVANRKKIKPSHEIACNTIPMQRHLSFSVPTKHLSSWGDLFETCFPLLFTTLVLNDSWTGGILNVQYLLLYCTPSKWLLDRPLIQSTLVLKIPYLVYLAKTTLLNLS